MNNLELREFNKKEHFSGDVDCSYDISFSCRFITKVVSFCDDNIPIGVERVSERSYTSYKLLSSTMNMNFTAVRSKKKSKLEVKNSKILYMWEVRKAIPLDNESKYIFCVSWNNSKNERKKIVFSRRFKYAF